MYKSGLGKRFHYNVSFNPSPMKLNLLELIQIGELCLEPGFEVGLHDQSCHEISYIVSGRGFFEQSGERTAVSAGDIIISPCSGPHAIYAAENESLYYAYTAFRFLDAGLPGDDTIASVFRSPDQIVCQDHSDIYRHYRSCIDEFHRPAEGNRLVIEASLLQIIVWTCRNLTNFPMHSEYEMLTKSPGSLVYRIMKHIDQNIGKPLTVSDIADSMGYSTYYISHLFREKTGSTLQDYITNRKVETAREYLDLNRFSMTQIAEKLGYPNLQSFSRVFRKKTGLSPTAYAKKHKQEDAAL